MGPEVLWAHLPGKEDQPGVDVGSDKAIALSGSTWTTVCSVKI